MIRIILGFSLKAVQARREWGEAYKILGEKTHQTKIFYPVKLLFKNKNNKEFLKQKLREFVASSSTLQKMF